MKIFSTTFPSSVEENYDFFDILIKKCATANRYISFAERACHSGLLIIRDNSISLNQQFSHSRQGIPSMKYCTYILEPSELAAAS